MSLHAGEKRTACARGGPCRPGAEKCTGRASWEFSAGGGVLMFAGANERGAREDDLGLAGGHQRRFAIVASTSVMPRTSADVCSTTALPSEADMPGPPRDVAEGHHIRTSVRYVWLPRRNRSRAVAHRFVSVCSRIISAVGPLSQPPGSSRRINRRGTIPSRPYC